MIINGKEYKFKRTMRSIMMFEQMKDKSISELSERIEDLVSYYYCVLKACNKESEITFDEFVDALDEDETLLGQMT